MSRYLVADRQADSEQPDFEHVLARAHRSQQRPRCLCTESGVEMYVARLEQRFVIKRMPDSGSRHSPTCTSYEPPPELSGLGELVGGAIQEELSSGLTKLRLGFSLTKQGGGAAPPKAGTPAPSVRTEGSKLGLRACLHYLWEQAALHAWSPDVSRQRTWGSVRSALLEAARSTVTKRSPLAELLLIPEPWSPERGDMLAARRRARLAPLAKADGAARQLMLLVAEVKDVAPARYGHRLLVEHMPDFPFLLAEDIHRRMKKRFAVEIDLWRTRDKTHLVTVATFGLSASGIAIIEEMSLMATSQHWVPVEDGHDEELVTSLAKAQRSFRKGLRYNLSADHPLASAVLVDCVPRPVAMYVLPPESDQAYRHQLGELISDSELLPWVWRAGEDAMPPAPTRQGYEAMAIDLDEQARPQEADREDTASCDESSEGADPPASDCRPDELDGEDAAH